MAGTIGGKVKNKVLANYPFKEKAEKEMIGFSSLRTDPTLLKEAKEKGFDETGNYFNTLFSELFFDGGRLNFRNDLDLEFKKNATKYLKCFMGSFEPSHEDKEAVSALILSELVKEV